MEVDTKKHAWRLGEEFDDQEESWLFQFCDVCGVMRDEVTELLECPGDADA